MPKGVKRVTRGRRLKKAPATIKDEYSWMPLAHCMGLLAVHPDDIPKGRRVLGVSFTNGDDDDGPESLRD